MVGKEYFSPTEIQVSDATEDEVDRLSFSDLLLNNTFSINDDFSKQYTTSSTDQDNLFEFFSHDFTASSANHYPATDIVFCGKLIPVAQKNQKQSPSRVFPCKSISLSVSSQPQIQQGKSYKTCRSFPCIKKDGTARNRTPIIPTKPRWNLFGSFPMEMKLGDIKTRQNKRKPPRTMFRCEYNDKMVKKDRSKKSKGLWAFLRVFTFTR